MVGLIKVWLSLTALILLAGCVPQLKQTECGANEAFSSSLRSCIPVSREPASFVKIGSYLPSAALTKYKSDSGFITFTVDIENPYSQTYTTEWSRNYNGSIYPISPDTERTYSLAPIELISEIGLHVITVTVKSSTGAVLDTHNFQLNITENPKPVIATSPANPAMYASVMTPSELPVNFEIEVRNNNATMVGAGYRVDWSVYRLGLLIDTESDLFPTSIPLGSTSPTGKNYPRYTFNPASIDGIIIGNYIIKATLTNTLNEVVDERTWSVNVNHPSLPKITSRNLYAGSSSPSWNTKVKAYNGTAYSASTPYNFVPCNMVGSVCVPVNHPGATPQADFCVTVDDGEGTYAGDGHFVRVDFYLDGGTNVYTAYTSASDRQVCLSDGGPAVLNAVVFNNTSGSVEQPHTIMARVTDEATNIEYTATDMSPSLGGYPIVWNLTVLPQNSAPEVAFGTVSAPDVTLSSCTSSGNTRNNCVITSDTDFKVNIKMVRDDFYSLGTDEANFDYSLRLYQDGVLVQTCNKSDPGFDSTIDTDGTNGYDCVFNIRSFSGSGPIDVTTKSYQIQAEIMDNGSPIVGTPATSSTLIWNIPAGNVIERNISLDIANWSVSGPVSEGGTLNFSADITDDELDHFNYVVEYCANGTTEPCSNYLPLTSGSITRTSSTNPYPFSLNYPLSESFLHQFTGLGCDQLATGDTCSILFRLKVTDAPDTAAPITKTTSGLISVITNVNPPPTLNIALASPNPTTFTDKYAFVGLPMSFSVSNPAFASDTSVPGVERVLRYQWYVKNTTDLDYEEIPGASGHSLIWTPSLMSNLTSDNPVSIMVCVDDQPEAAVGTPRLGISQCTDGTPWNMEVRNNIASLFDLSTTPGSTELANTAGQAGNEMAVWYEEPTTFNGTTSSAAYVAMIGNDKRIYVKKALVKDNGEIDTINAAHIVSFDAVPTGTVDQIRNISITGNQGVGVPASELYIAYAASRTGAPSSLYPQVRRIDLTSTPGKIAPNQHPGKFGFDYDGLDFENNCNPLVACTFDKSIPGQVTLEFAHTGTITGNFILKTPDGDFTFHFGGASDDTNTICETCSTTTMATDFADIINKSLDHRLVGYAANNYGTAVTTIFGALPDDYFDASTHPQSRIADQVGKIYVVGGNWYLPFINSSLGGSYNDKLSVYRGPAGNVIGNTIVTIDEPTAGNGLETMASAVVFDNYYDGTNLWIGLVSKIGSAGKLYAVDPETYAVNMSQDIMTSDVALDIQVSGNTSGNVFAGVRVSSGNKFKLGVYTTALSTQAEFEMDDLLHIDPTSITEDIFNPDSIGSYRIIPYGVEARIVATSKATGSDYQLYMARLRNIGGNWTLSCGDCKQISFLGHTVSEAVKIAAAPIRKKDGAPYRLSSDGSTASQGIRDVAFVAFGSTDPTLGGVDPTLGVLNVEAEAISIPTIFEGASPVEDRGLFRPPLIKAN